MRASNVNWHKFGLKIIGEVIVSNKGLKFHWRQRNFRTRLWTEMIFGMNRWWTKRTSHLLIRLSKYICKARREIDSESWCRCLTILGQATFSQLRNIISIPIASWIENLAIRRSIVVNVSNFAILGGKKVSIIKYMRSDEVQRSRMPKFSDAYASNECVLPQVQQDSKGSFRIVYPHSNGGVQVLGLW